MMQTNAIKLGKLLVQELGVASRGDTLSTWMAYYIAEQIEISKRAEGATKAAADEKCFNAILDLWKHRAFLPEGHRPLESFEPVFRALARLDPEKAPVFYHHLEWNEKPKDAPEPSQVDKLLDFIFQMDKVARTLIQEALSQATAAATSKKAKRFLKEATLSSHDEDIRIVVHLWKSTDRAPSSAEKRVALKQELQKKIELLETFTSTAAKVKGILERTLEKL